jgi:hypothetical protein
MSATCPRPCLAQVCDGSATGIIADPGRIPGSPTSLVWSGLVRVALVEFGLYVCMPETRYYAVEIKDEMKGFGGWRRAGYIVTLRLNFEQTNDQITI